MNLFGRHIHSYSQNLREDKRGRPIGSKLWHARAWLKIGGRGQNPHHGPWTTTTFGAEWGIGPYARSCHAYLELNGYGENQIMLALAIPFLFSIYLFVEHLLPKHWLPGHWRPSTIPPHELIWDSVERQIGFDIYGGGLWLHLWNNRNESSSRDPWWWSIHIYPADLLLGDRKYSARDLYSECVNVQLPEGPYPSTVRIFESTWKRPRWPWPRRMIRAEITPDTPIPNPGKGENSWDLGDDATYSMTCPAHTPAEAADMLARSILRDRERYGGANWKPSKGSDALKGE